MLSHLLLIPYQGNYKVTSKTNTSNKEFDEYEIVALAKRLGFTLQDLKEMSFVTLANIMLSTVNEEDEVREGNQEDIERYFG